jgi:hypothetical protein
MALVAFPGVRQTTLNAVNIETAFGAGSEFSLILGPRGVPSITWQVVYSETPSSCTIDLEGSLDGTNWFVIDTTTSISGALRTIEGSYRFIRANNSATGAGNAGKTVTVTFIYTCRVGISTLERDGIDQYLLEHDCWNTIQPLSALAISSGTQTFVTGLLNHPGVLTLKSSSSANSGVAFGNANAATSSIRIQGGEEFTTIFRLDRLTDVTFNLGFHDKTSASGPVDAVCLSVAPTTGVATGQAISNSSATNTASTYTLALSTWYRLVIKVNDDATAATFYLYDSATESLVWTDSVASNLPTDAGSELGCLITCIHSGSSALDLISVDYYRLRYNGSLNR